MERHARQEIFGEIGKEGQKKLRRVEVSIVGLGALGSMSGKLLARAGIGSLNLIDRDLIELSNLQRQHLFCEEDIGKPKAETAKKYLEKINSEISIKAYFDNLDFTNIEKLLVGLVLDCTDNLETRFLINEFCLKRRVPFVHASALGSEGYVFDIVPGKKGLASGAFSEK